MAFDIDFTINSKIFMFGLTILYWTSIKYFHFLLLHCWLCIAAIILLYKLTFCLVWAISMLTFAATGTGTGTSLFGAAGVAAASSSPFHWSSSSLKFLFGGLTSLVTGATSAYGDTSSAGSFAGVVGTSTGVATGASSARAASVLAASSSSSSSSWIDSSWSSSATSSSSASPSSSSSWIDSSWSSAAAGVSVDSALA